MPSANQFTALGPSAVGFQTDGANINVGAEIGGSEVGGRFSCEKGNALEGISDPQNVSPTVNIAGVFGQSSGIGVRGSGSGFGIFGFVFEGRGAVLEADKIAQLRLSPADSSFGAQTLPSGDTGDLYVRSIPNTPAPKNDAQIFFCLGKVQGGRSLWVPLTFGAAVLGA